MPENKAVLAQLALEVVWIKLLMAGFSNTFIYFCTALCVSFPFASGSRDFDDQLVEDCILPPYIRNPYYSRENGLNTFITVDASSFERKVVASIASSIIDTSTTEDTVVKETCIKMSCNRPSKSTRKCQTVMENGQTVYDSDMYRLLIKDTSKNCFRCRELVVRTINVLEFRQTECYSSGAVESLPLLCKSLHDRLVRHEAQWVTLFSVNPTPVSCRSSIEGVWKFQYHLEQYSGHHCKHPKNNLTSCPDPGNRYSTENRFYISYGSCSEMSWRKEDPGMVPFRDSTMTFTCLGDWYVGKDHYFAAANLGENRPEEKYRCFIENRDDDQYLGQSLTASCSNLKTPRRSPVILRLERVKPMTVNATCYLPKNFTGKWINTAYAAVDSKVEMNATHLLDIQKPDQGVAVLTTYVCQEQKKNRFMMARVGVGGCQVYYVCWHFLPRHHNIIRYRVGIAYAQKDFRLVCSWTSFLQQREWKFDLLIASSPFPIECPIGGKFIFTQAGDIPLHTRVRGGVTKSPRDQVECKQYETDFSVCPHQWYKQYTTKQILIDLDKCMTLDWQAKPIGEYDEPDYILHCIGYWRENARSFLVTYEKEDVLSPFRCWVYNRISYSRILLSRGAASFCGVHQQPDSQNFSYGASLALDLSENERLFDDCPLRFIDGSDPWAAVGQYGLLNSAFGEFWSWDSSAFQAALMTLFYSLTMRHLH